MKNFYLFIIFSLLTTQSLASTKKDIIKNLQKTNNLSFNFEQNINGKIENGNCSLEYPKKIYCEYNLENKKTIVSNGKNIVIKTQNSYYLYSINKTPLNLILDKKLILDKISNLNERILDDKFINFKFYQNENEINVFFDKKNYNLVGWQTIDIYQNVSITFLSSIKKNQKLKKELFKLPSQN